MDEEKTKRFLRNKGSGEKKDIIVISPTADFE